jgi:hypothetical protein
MTITSNTPNIANAGPDFIVCGQTSVTFGANAVNGGFWTGGLGTFIPDRNTPNAIYTPALSEVGTLSLLRWNLPDPDGAGPCPVASALTTIISNTPAIANAGPDQVTCGATSLTLAANAVTGGNWIGGTGTFNPGRNTANATYTLSAGELIAGLTLTWNVPDPDGTGPVWLSRMT